MATDSQKEKALRKAEENKSKRVKIKKSRKSLVKKGGRSAIEEEILEVPFGPDTGADDNIISRYVAKELQELQSYVKMDKLKTPMTVNLVDGREVICTERCKVNVQLVTVAGLGNLIDLQSLVFEEGSDGFLLGDRTLKSLGIGVDHLLEQRASNNEQFQEEHNVPKEDTIELNHAASVAIAKTSHKFSLNLHGDTQFHDSHYASHDFLATTMIQVVLSLPFVAVI
ncbi:hypothetical protein PsorP6_010968 [Peronosclerospora sorghi]|uniref:Uncharacterized protein n=1 Tax=Peronosclerospora sorghi TaxID=230839 RepID=A0ACC0VV88_9STRA|nr:hypothetical protein PsorP6_010968 [Peronosclerospora sorghi]